MQPNTVVVLIHGGPLAAESAATSSKVRAILDAFQPGELGADAIMQMVVGETSPSGLMPYTTYLQNFTARDIREVDLKVRPCPAFLPVFFGGAPQFSFKYCVVRTLSPAHLEKTFQVGPMPRRWSFLYSYCLRRSRRHHIKGKSGHHVLVAYRSCAVSFWIWLELH